MQRNSVYFLALGVLVLIVIGLVALSSTSAFAEDSDGLTYAYLKKQSLWLAIGVLVCMVAASIDYHFWRKTVWIWYLLAVVLLALCFVPSIGQRINGSARWIHLGLTFQPSELAKLSAIVLLAYWFSRFRDSKQTFFKGFLLPGLLVLVLLALIVVEVDLGSTLLIGATAGILMFVAGTRWLYLTPVALAAVFAAILAVMLIPERMDRVLAFTDLEKYQQGAGLQQHQALIAFGSGGVSGLGLGEGRQKMLYLPYAHTDFIFAMIGEEMGLQITLLVVFVYVVIIVSGTTIAISAKDSFGLLLGTGIVVLLSLQAAVNIGVTTALLPNKGLPLPFISYGGSNLVLCLLCVGILISIYRQGTTGTKVKVGNRLHVRVLKRL